jgi:hypothetical protein
MKVGMEMLFTLLAEWSLLEVLCCIRFKPVQGVGVSSVYVQPSPHRMVRRPFPGPTRGTAATLGGFSPLSTYRGLEFFPPRCLYM